MKASSNFLITKFSVNGLILTVLTCFLSTTVFGIADLNGQQAGDPSSGGAFVAPIQPPTIQPPTAPTASLPDASAPQVDSGHVALLKARQALAVGDIASAKSLVDTARQFPIDSSLTDDTPAKVEAMIARHAELAEMARVGDENQYNYGAALFLLEQAEGLIDYRDLAAAQSLVMQARQFPVEFKPGDRNPDHVLARLQQIRNSAPATAQNVSAEKMEAARLMSQAQLAFDRNRLDEAQRLVNQVKQMNLDDSAFDGSSILPWDLDLKIAQARNNSAPAMQAAFDSNQPGGVVRQADYYPELDTTQNIKASAALPAETRGNTTDTVGDFNPNDVRGKQLYDSGIAALSNNDVTGAMEYFRMALQYKDQLDPAMQQDLQTKLTELRLQAAPMSFQQPETIAGVDEDLRRKMFSDVLRQRAVAERMLEQRNPRGALNHLRLLRDQVETSELDPAGKQQLMAVVEREISEMERYVQDNLSEIENDEINAARMQQVEMRRQHRDDIERKIQQLVSDFNQLMDEQRYAEAEVIARQANEIAPDMEVVSLMVERARIQGIAEMSEQVRQDKSDSFIREMLEADEKMISGANFSNPLVYDPPTWERIMKMRDRNFSGEGYSTEEERLIWSAIKNQKIQAQFNQTPLSEAIDILAERAGVNMIFDTRALELENVAIDKPVNMNIPNPISVESALKIILGNNNLVFMVEDEVVKITNKDALQSEPKEKHYYVGDLVMPVPDYGNPMNLEFLTPQNSGSQWNANPVRNGLAGLDPSQPGNITPVSMAQQAPGNPLGGFGFNPMWNGSGPQTSTPQYNRMGPQGVRGGITEQDFDELMNLIQETIDPDSWEENGGSGRMQPFPSTLSLIVTQTQENQDRIQNLLQRLRELNDVQIVVEVRFITLRDDFFERIGIDFDFRINDNANFTATTIPEDASTTGGSATIGRAPIAELAVPTLDLDIPFNQNSFGSAVPQFGGFDPATAANFGFAILSDIEVFFLLQAAKGDQRSNVVQAPTVTMFNGQSASVFDGSLQPFVTSIQPIVGDFAAAQQPIITILPEGTQLNVRAVVSSDRRFVKMTLVPFFSEITQVDTFQFDGERTVRRGSGTTLNDILNAIDGNNDNDDALGDDELEITESGTTVQLPVFANTTITTTVSVPDGGTVLLGGIKRMSEGRTERGLPFLSNIPYVNRLFKNVGIGRETSSLMMMVTPRIIIQEEEEQFQVGAPGN